MEQCPPLISSFADFRQMGELYSSANFFGYSFDRKWSSWLHVFVLSATAMISLPVAATPDPARNGRQTVNRFTLQPEGIYFIAANLNVDVNPSNSALGFKLNHTYAIHALYDLRRLASDFGNNGIRLADYDNLGSQGYNDIIDLEVGRSTLDRSLRLLFICRDLRLQTRVIISSTFLNDALGDQIELSLLKETANDPTITGGILVPSQWRCAKCLQSRR
jgi:hypothetical protein